MEIPQWFQNNLKNEDILNTVFFTDEASFYLSGYVTLQNMRLWSSENPHFVFVDEPLHHKKAGGLVGIYRKRLVGPFHHLTFTGILKLWLTIFLAKQNGQYRQNMFTNEEHRVGIGVVIISSISRCNKSTGIITRKIIGIISPTIGYDVSNHWSQLAK